MKLNETRKGWTLKAWMPGDQLRASDYAKKDNKMYVGPVGPATPKLKGVQITEKRGK